MRLSYYDKFSRIPSMYTINQ